MTRAATQAEINDHRHDHRKHDFDPLPLSVQTAPIATAMDIVLCVRGMKNLQDAAFLVEQYAQTVAAAAKLDLAIEYDRRIGVALESPLLEKFEVPNV